VNPLERLLDVVLGEPVQAPQGVAVPDGVVIRSGRWVPVLGGLMGSMSGPAAAVTLGRSIVVHPRYPLDEKLLAHELVHVRQWREDRWFPVKYALGSIRHGYWMNPYEVEARAEADRMYPDPT
jgi:hypothetical protein